MIEEVVEKILNEHGGNILGFCIALTGNRAEGEDLFQDTFLRLSIISKKIDKDDNLKSFAMSIAARIYKDNYKKNLRRNKIAPTLYNEEVFESLISPENVESSVEKRELNEFLRKEILSLDEIYKIVILLFYIADLKIDNIAEILNIPSGTVKSRLNKARELLRKGLEEKGYESYR